MNKVQPINLNILCFLNVVFIFIYLQQNNASFFISSGYLKIFPTYLIEQNSGNKLF